MSSSASSSKPADKAPEKPKDEEESQPHLGVLEEDDEFEEFPVAGSLVVLPRRCILTAFCLPGMQRLGRRSYGSGALEGRCARRRQIGGGQALGG